MGVGF